MCLGTWCLPGCVGKAVILLHKRGWFLALLKQADEAGEEDLAEGFMEMAHEEYTHAQFIYNEMVEEHHPIGDAHKKMWEELDAMMGNLF